MARVRYSIARHTTPPFARNSRRRFRCMPFLLAPFPASAPWRIGFICVHTNTLSCPSTAHTWTRTVCATRAVPLVSRRRYAPAEPGKDETQRIADADKSCDWTLKKRRTRSMVIDMFGAKIDFLLFFFFLFLAGNYWQSDWPMTGGEATPTPSRRYAQLFGIPFGRPSGSRSRLSVLGAGGKLVHQRMHLAGWNVLVVGCLSTSLYIEAGSRAISSSSSINRSSSGSCARRDAEQPGGSTEFILEPRRRHRRPRSSIGTWSYLFFRPRYIFFFHFLSPPAEVREYRYSSG